MKLTQECINLLFSVELVVVVRAQISKYHTVFQEVVDCDEHLFADDASTIYALRESGDYEAFRDYVEQIRNKKYTAPLGGGAEGGGIR